VIIWLFPDPPPLPLYGVNDKKGAIFSLLLISPFFQEVFGNLLHSGSTLSGSSLRNCHPGMAAMARVDACRHETRPTSLRTPAAGLAVGRVYGNKWAAWIEATARLAGFHWPWSQLSPRFHHTRCRRHRGFRGIPTFPSTRNKHPYPWELATWSRPSVGAENRR